MLFRKTDGKTAVGSNLSVLMRDYKMLHSRLGGVTGRESLNQKATIVQKKRKLDDGTYQ